MQWVKASERWPDVNDKSSVSANGRIVIRWADSEVFHTADVHVANKHLVGPRTEWLEGAFVPVFNKVDTNEPNPIPEPIQKVKRAPLWLILLAGGFGGVLVKIAFDVIEAILGQELP